MKRAIIIAICSVVLFAWPAYSSVGFINLYSEPSGIGCIMYDTTPGYFKVYVFHVWNSEGVSGSRFKVVSGGGFTATYISE